MWIRTWLFQVNILYSKPAKCIKLWKVIFTIAYFALECWCIKVYFRFYCCCCVKVGLIVIRPLYIQLGHLIYSTAPCSADLLSAADISWHVIVGTAQMLLITLTMTVQFPVSQFGTWPCDTERACTIPGRNLKLKQLNWIQPSFILSGGIHLCLYYCDQTQISAVQWALWDQHVFCRIIILRKKKYF